MKRTAGFTLIELLVVLAIVALIASIALPNLKMPGFASDAARAGRQIASGLADARQRAIQTNRESAFILDLAARSYRVGPGEPVDLPGIDRLTLLTAERDVIDAASGLIRFYPDGSSDGGEIAVRDAGGAAITIRVNWLTGKITHDG